MPPSCDVCGASALAPRVLKCRFCRYARLSPEDRDALDAVESFEGKSRRDRYVLS